MKLNNDSKWQTLDSQEGEDLIIFKARYDRVKNPRNGKIIKAIVLESDDAVNIVAITKAKKILMVEQYRFGIGALTLEIPGGFVDKGEAPLTAAQRELSEETGFSSTQWKALGSIPSNPVFMNSYVHHWLAEGVEKTDIRKLDEGENIEILELTPEEIKTRIQQGTVTHPHTISALARIFQLW